MKNDNMDWYNFKQLKGQSVQRYTQEFRRRCLIFGIELNSQDTLLKYIGGLHIYLWHIILIFNPTILDEVCVHATHFELRGKIIPQEGSKKPFTSGNKGKNKFKGKGKKNSYAKKEGEKLTCKNCSKEGHDEAHCWKLHLEMKPKKFNNKGKQKTTATTQHDLGSDSRDETKITAMGMKGKDISSTSSSSCRNDTKDEKKII